MKIADLQEQLFFNLRVREQLITLPKHLNKEQGFSSLSTYEI